MYLFTSICKKLKWFAQYTICSAMKPEKKKILHSEKSKYHLSTMWFTIFSPGKENGMQNSLISTWHYSICHKTTRISSFLKIHGVVWKSILHQVGRLASWALRNELTGRGWRCVRAVFDNIIVCVHICFLFFSTLDFFLGFMLRISGIVVYIDYVMVRWCCH